MDGFASLIHPLDAKQDAARKYPILARTLPTPLLRLLTRFWPPLVISHVRGVRSQGTGQEIEGWLLACPLAARQMLRLPPQVVYDKIVRTGQLAQKQGARILGLGGLTSVVGDGGVTVAQRLRMPVTTGNSLKVASAIAALTEAVEAVKGSVRARSASQGVPRAGLAMKDAVVAVVGASGSVGLACAEMLAPRVGALILVGHREIHLSRARAIVEAAGAVGKVRVSTRFDAIREADVVLSATSAAQPLIEPEHLKKGAVVCDVALPPDVSPTVRREREDVLLIDGGIVDVPGPVDFGFDFGLPAGRAYACMAEVMVLALEGRYESFSLGQKVETEKVREIAQLAQKHGFSLAARVSSRTIT